MRILGLDVGNKRIGVAVSDELFITAQGIEVIERKNLKHDVDRISDLIKKYDVGKIVIGLPRNMDGSIGPQGKIVEEFSEKVRAAVKTEIEFWDERLTTVTAERTLIDADISRKKRKGIVDKVAAVIILQNYLDSKR